MKKLLLLSTIIYSVNCLAQNPDPVLFQTWYLSYLQLSDTDTPYNVETINPAITPTLNISKI